jgi:D-alanyl-D-alanine carboxypeptidase
VEAADARNAGAAWCGAEPARWCIIPVVTPAIRQSRPRLPAGLVSAIAIVVAVAACGSPAPTPTATGPLPATPSPTAALATNSPTAALVASIVPVPITQLAEPASLATRLDPAKSAALQAALETVRSGGKYPGASAAIVFPDGSIWTGVSGAAILSPQTPLTATTLFSIGSISKTFLAALIGQLASVGTLALDDPLAKYLPDYPNAANITLRQLLNHTSGLRDPSTDSSFNDAVLSHPDVTWTADQFLSWVGRPYCAPGTCYQYSNTNYIVLGKVVEKITGQPVAALVRSAFLDPLGLSHTYLQTEEQAQGAEAHGYMPPAAGPTDNSAGTMIPFTAEATAFGFAGAYVSTPSDLAVWANDLYGGRVLDQATLASMVDVSPTLPFKTHYGLGYGLGFEETTVAGQVAWGHRGHLDGFWSAMEYLPAYHVTVVVLTNAEWADPVAATSALAQIAIG